MLLDILHLVSVELVLIILVLDFVVVIAVPDDDESAELRIDAFVCI